MNKTEIFLTLFYVGKIKTAPGTFGSLASLIIFYIINELLFARAEGFNLLNSNLFWLLAITILTILGSKLTENYSHQQNKEIDHKSIVLDEFVGQVIASQITINLINLNQDLRQIENSLLVALIGSFILFRTLDITKPLLIGYLDKKLKTGFGVFLDDILAGLLSGVLIWIAGMIIIMAQG